MRAVVADDHPVFRQGLRVLLEDLGVEVVAEAEDGEEAVAAVQRERPDVVLMDLQMPRLSGVEATRRLIEQDPDVRDDGGGIASGRTAGVGLSSMRERAAELGGTVHVTPAPGGGTRVSAVLPLGGEP